MTLVRGVIDVQQHSTQFGVGLVCGQSLKPSNKLWSVVWLSTRTSQKKTCCVCVCVSPFIIMFSAGRRLAAPLGGLAACGIGAGLFGGSVATCAPKEELTPAASKYVDMFRHPRLVPISDLARQVAYDCV